MSSIHHERRNAALYGLVVGLTLAACLALAAGGQQPVYAWIDHREHRATVPPCTTRTSYHPSPWGSNSPTGRSHWDSPPWSCPAAPGSARCACPSCHRRLHAELKREGADVTTEA